MKLILVNTNCDGTFCELFKDYIEALLCLKHHLIDTLYQEKRSTMF